MGGDSLSLSQRSPRAMWGHHRTLIWYHHHLVEFLPPFLTRRHACAGGSCAASPRGSPPRKVVSSRVQIVNALAIAHWESSVGDLPLIINYPSPNNTKQVWTLARSGEGKPPTSPGHSRCASKRAQIPFGFFSFFSFFINFFRGLLEGGVTRLGLAGLQLSA